jgi:hypothetical protein
MQEETRAHEHKLAANSTVVHEALQLCDEAEGAVLSVGDLVTVGP